MKDSGADTREVLLLVGDQSNTCGCICKDKSCPGGKERQSCVETWIRNPVVLRALWPFPWWFSSAKMIQGLLMPTHTAYMAQSWGQWCPFFVSPGNNLVRVIWYFSNSDSGKFFVKNHFLAPGKGRHYSCT